jgi:Sporulation related domain.
MKIYFFICVALLLCILPLNAQQQLERVAAVQFFQKMTEPDLKTGSTVQITQDSRIYQLFENMAAGGVQQTMSISGFRVQVYSSNVQKTAKDEAYRIETELKAAFPEHAVYVTYSSPFWKVRLGDFKTNAEADAFRALLISKFPSLKNYTYVVKDQIKI